MSAAPLLTEGDLDRGRPLDVAEDGVQRRSGFRELPPDACRYGHLHPRYQLGWEPGRGRSYRCTADGCTSVQFRC